MQSQVGLQELNIMIQYDSMYEVGEALELLAKQLDEVGMKTLGLGLSAVNFKHCCGVVQSCMFTYVHQQLVGDMLLLLLSYYLCCDYYYYCNDSDSYWSQDDD